MKTETNFQDILCCPECGGELARQKTGVACRSCAARFETQMDLWVFTVFDETHTEDSQFQVEQLTNQTLAARAFNFGSRIVNSDYEPVKHLQGFLKNVETNAKIVELGSGSRRLLKSIINVDIFTHTNVDILANIAKTPFQDSSIDYVVLDTVLEHVPEPQSVVNEIRRILKPKGLVLSITPFVFPYHGYPKHYYNFSEDGLRHLYREFDIRWVETNIGPSACLTNLISEYFAIAFSGRSKLAYAVLKGIFLLPIFLLKYLDYFWQRHAKSTRLASHISILAEKR